MFGTRIPVPAEMSITTADGVLEGAVQWPASVAAFSEATVTFHVPIPVAWEFAVNGDAQLGWEELTPNIGVCSLELRHQGDGDSTFSCLSVPYGAGVAREFWPSDNAPSDRVDTYPPLHSCAGLRASEFRSPDAMSRVTRADEFRPPPAFYW